MYVGMDMQHSLHLKVPSLQMNLQQRSKVKKHQRNIIKSGNLLIDKTKNEKEKEIDGSLQSPSVSGRIFKWPS